MFVDTNHHPRKANSMITTEDTALESGRTSLGISVFGLSVDFKES
jgi:hypothetical protein